jgi:hypothetical protein
VPVDAAEVKRYGRALNSSVDYVAAGYEGLENVAGSIQAVNADWPVLSLDLVVRLFDPKSHRHVGVQYAL